MSPPKHNSAPWSKWSIAFFAAAILLLIAGASPYNEITAVYKSSIMLLLGLIIAFLSLIAVFFIGGKSIGLLLIHLGSFLILTGAYIDYGIEQKMNGTLYVGEEYFPNPADKGIAPEFRFVARDFKVEYYTPPVYALMDATNRKELEEGVIVDDNIVFPNNNGAVPLSRMQAVASGPHPFIFLKESKIVYLKKKPLEKYYEVDFLITDEDGAHEFKMAVNHPVTHQGWRFYLMSHGQHEGKQYVQLLVRCAPGRYCVQGGALLLVLGSFWFGFIRKRKETNQV